MSLKNPVTTPGIGPGTVRLVAQRLNHYATPGPQILCRYALDFKKSRQERNNCIYFGSLCGEMLSHGHQTLHRLCPCQTVASCRPIRKAASLSASCVQLEEVNSRYQLNGLPAELVFHLSEADVLNGKAEGEKQEEV